MGESNFYFAKNLKDFNDLSVEPDFFVQFKFGESQKLQEGGRYKNLLFNNFLADFDIKVPIDWRFATEEYKNLAMELKKSHALLDRAERAGIEYKIFDCFTGATRDIKKRIKLLQEKLKADLNEHTRQPFKNKTRMATFIKNQKLIDGNSHTLRDFPIEPYFPFAIGFQIKGDNAYQLENKFLSLRTTKKDNCFYRKPLIFRGLIKDGLAICGANRWVAPPISNDKDDIRVQAMGTLDPEVFQSPYEYVIWDGKILPNGKVRFDGDRIGRRSNVQHRYKQLVFRMRK